MSSLAEKQRKSVLNFSFDLLTLTEQYDNEK